MPEKKQRKTGKEDPLTQTGIRVGKALARSAFKVESTGRKAQKTAKKLIESATKTAEGTMEDAADKVKKLTHPPRAKSAKAAVFKPAKGLSVEAHVGFLAGDIHRYLEEHGPVAVEKIVHVMKRRKNTVALIHAAMGWLARERKVRFTQSGDNISLP